MCQHSWLFASMDFNTQFLEELTQNRPFRKFWNWIQLKLKAMWQHGTDICNYKLQYSILWRILKQKCPLTNFGLTHNFCIRIATSYEPWLDFQQGQKISLYSRASTLALAPTQPTYPVGTGGSFPRGKAAKTWSQPLTSIQWQAQEWWSYNSTPTYLFMAWSKLIKNRKTLQHGYAYSYLWTKACNSLTHT
jgi:hypothetical protein